MSEDFLNKWQSIGEEHIKVDLLNNDKFYHGSEALNFLILFGIPSEFQDLNFDYLKNKELETVNERWRLSNSEFDKYLVIGFNGSGDSISINQLNQELIYLNHDNGFNEIFINSDLRRFADSVLRIQEFISQITKLTSDSFFETEFSDENYEALIIDLKRIDPKVFEVDSSHWPITLETIKYEREDERDSANL